MTDRIEARADGLYTIRDVFGKPLEQQVQRGWFVLFTDSDGIKRLAFVCRVHTLLQQLQVMDATVYPNAPAPMDEPSETVTWNQVLEANGGFYRPRRDVWTSEKKHGFREVWVLHESSGTGFIVTKVGPRRYVDLLNGKWIVR
jgi:hypothetical protein